MNEPSGQPKNGAGSEQGCDMIRTRGEVRRPVFSQTVAGMRLRNTGANHEKQGRDGQKG